MQRIIENVNNNENETQNSRVKAAIYLSCVAGVCTILILILVSEHILYFDLYYALDSVSMNSFLVDFIRVQYLIYLYNYLVGCSKTSKPI